MEIFIPYHQKDSLVIARCIEAARQFVQPRPARISLIASEFPPGIGADNFIDESTLIPGLTKRDVPQGVVEGRNLSGWYFQQFLKLAACELAREDCYLILDADCVFVAPISFREAGKYILYQNDRPLHAPYFRTMERLLGLKMGDSRSFICDYMVLDKTVVREMLAEIERRHPGKPWHRAIIDAIDPGDLCAFSEFETYAHFMQLFHPESLLCRPCKGGPARGQDVAMHETLARIAVAQGLNSISYHSYL
jgi:uncharacterized protein DUF6492